MKVIGRMRTIFIKSALEDILFYEVFDLSFCLQTIMHGARSE